MKITLFLRRHGILEEDPQSYCDLVVVIDIHTTAEGIYCSICKCGRYEEIVTVENIVFNKCVPRVLTEEELVDLENETQREVEQILRSMPSCSFARPPIEGHENILKEKFMLTKYELQNYLHQ